MIDIAVGYSCLSNESEEWTLLMRITFFTAIFMPSRSTMNTKWPDPKKERTNKNQQLESKLIYLHLLHTQIRNRKDITWAAKKVLIPARQTQYTCNILFNYIRIRFEWAINVKTHAHNKKQALAHTQSLKKATGRDFDEVKFVRCCSIHIHTIVAGKILWNVQTITSFSAPLLFSWFTFRFEVKCRHTQDSIYQSFFDRCSIKAKN